VGTGYHLFYSHAHLMVQRMGRLVQLIWLGAHNKEYENMVWHISQYSE
jgi:hypothetical protein